MRAPTAISLLCLAAVLTACGSNPGTAAPEPSVHLVPPLPLAQPLPNSDGSHGYALGAVPPLLSAADVYAAGRPGMLSAAVAGERSLIYVPDLAGNELTVIDPTALKVIDHYPVGQGPQHVVPSYDLQTLWVNDSKSNDLLPVNPRTGKPAGKPVAVDDPYNLYFTPDGRYAMVMAERLHRIDFRDPHTMKLVLSLPVPCAGVNHADFAADGRSFLASCEYSGQLLSVDLDGPRIRKVIELGAHAMPQDVKLSPDGSRYYVADMDAGGVHVFDARTLKERPFIRTGGEAHGLYPSRDSASLYVSNRTGHSVSVISFATDRVIATWPIPNGSPDMGGVSADGKVLWLSGRYNDEVYALSTTDGHLVARIPVGHEPHGLAVWPQPGRYSLGHTGILR